jgi:hypothetical protein
MGWRSIHWHRSEWRQQTRFERYADDSWMLLWSPFGHVYIAFKGRISDRAIRARRIRWQKANTPQYTPKEKP